MPYSRNDECFLEFRVKIFIFQKPSHAKMTPAADNDSALYFKAAPLFGSSPDSYLDEIMLGKSEVVDKTRTRRLFV